MQLICSDNRGLEDRLTIGKVYEGNLDKATCINSKGTPILLTISNDLGPPDTIEKIEVEDFREKQLNDLGI